MYKSVVGSSERMYFILFVLFFVCVWMFIVDVVFESLGVGVFCGGFEVEVGFVVGCGFFSR